MGTDADDPNIGRVIADRYQLVRQLGVGQMARVYVAEQLAMSRNVAVKLLLPDVQVDEVAIVRFRQEILAVGRLRSPHTIQCYDAGAEGGAPFIAMELLAGETLRQRLTRDVRVAPHEAVGIAAQVGASLQEAHEAGVLHRDLKPENVYLCTHPTPWHLFVKVLDFGLAKLTEPGAESFEVTAHGSTVGTPAYMAPEMIVRGRKVDHRADVYALGLMCFEMLTGQRPFNAATADEMIMAHVTRPIPRASEVAGFSPAVDAFFDAVLAKDAAGRPAQATEVATLLADALAR